MPKGSKSKITIGYLSNNYRNHPTSHLIVDIFGLHDRDHFKLNAYSYGEDDNSPYRNKIASDSDRFVDLRSMSHEQAANRIRDGPCRHPGGSGWVYAWSSVRDWRLSTGASSTQVVGPWQGPRAPIFSIILLPTGLLPQKIRRHFTVRNSSICLIPTK